LAILIIITVVGGLYMAWNIGANDVANAFGASVGSGALTLRRAILLAAVFEFLGAFLVGAPVAQTISGGIVPLTAFAFNPKVLALGMLAALLGAAVWLNVATCLGQPVSTTHAIIGAVIGFAAVAVGPQFVQWLKLGKIAASWVISPLAGGVLAYAIYRWGVRRYVLQNRHPVFMAISLMPMAMGGLVAIIAFSIVYKGLPGLRLDLPLHAAAAVALALGLTVGLILRRVTRRRRRRHHIRRRLRYQFVERWFGYMQVCTACYMSFAHGANDVANAIGPFSTVIQVLTGGGTLPEKVEIPPWVLAFGGVGIVLGLATYGYKVIEAIGKKITEITPTRGFSADFATATTVLVFSKLGMPISTTFVIVGAVMGVGLARGFAAIDLRVIRRIFTSWVVTIPASAVLGVLAYWTLAGLCL